MAFGLGWLPHVAAPKIQDVRDRILALDVGDRRIGLAVSDELGITAQGLSTLERGHERPDLDRLTALARERGVSRFLVGLPIQMNGVEGSRAALVRRLGEALHRHSGIPVEYWDERLTTREAGHVLRAAGSSRAQHRKSIDRLAAVILLQSYLDSGRCSE